MSAIDSSRGEASTGRGADLRFAGVVSAAMIATVLTLGALAAPLLTWNGSSGANARERSQTIRLSNPAPSAVAPTPAALRAGGQVVPAALRTAAAGRGAIGIQIRASMIRRAPGVSPALSRGLTVSTPTTQAKGPAPAAPLARSSDDTDGDGMPDVWEREYGLNPDNAGDAALDSDGDGLDNRMELRLRTAPTSADSNRNGVTDAQEDPDGDGAPNLAEQQAGTDPGSGTDVPPVVEAGNDPTPVATSGDEDGGGAGGDAPAPAAPDQPADAGPAPAPASEHSAPADTQPSQGNEDATPAAPAPAPATPATAPARSRSPVQAAPAKPAQPKAVPTKPAAPAKPAPPKAVPAKPAAPAKPAPPKAVRRAKPAAPAKPAPPKAVRRAKLAPPKAVRRAEPPPAAKPAPPKVLPPGEGSGSPLT